MGSQAAGGYERVGLLELAVLRRPHLVLAHAGHHDAVATSDLRQSVKHVLGQEFLGLPDVQGWMLRLEFGQTAVPVKVHVGLHEGHQLVQHHLEIAHYRHSGLDVLVQLRGVHVDVHHLGIGCKVAQPSGNPVIEAHPQPDQEVGLVNGQVVVGHAVHSGHAHVQYMVRWQGTDAQQRGYHGDLGFFRQLDELVIRLRNEHAVTSHNHWPLRIVDQLSGVGYLCRRGLSGRMVAGEIGLVGPDKLRPEVL